MAFRANNKKGFSLIALAAILAVIAILVVTLLPNDSDKHKDQVKKTSDKILAIQKAVKVFQGADANNSLPCPAGFNYKTTDGQFGTSLGGPSTTISANCSTTCAANSTYCSSNIVIGGVPTKTLGLPDDDAFDEWGNRLTYVINSANLSVPTTTGLNVVDLNDNSLPGIEALIISHGADGIGAWPRTPTASAPSCIYGTGITAAAQSELNNCAYLNPLPPYQFVKDNFYSTINNPDAFYDDIVGAVNGCPAGIGDCNLWLDASDASSINSGNPQANDLVAIWKDKSSLQNNVIPMSGMSGGKYLTASSPNSLPGIDFPYASNQAMITLKNSGITGNSNRTVFYAAKMVNPPSSTGGVIAFGGASTSGVFAPLEASSYVCTGYCWYFGSSGNDVPTSTQDNSLWNTHAVSYDSAQLTWDVNGNRIINQQILSQPLNTIASPIYLGLMPNVVWLTSTTGEIVVYPKTLSTSDRMKVECYLGKKWGIGVTGCHCPAGLLGCTLWLDASDINNGAGQPASGPIATWADKSGGANNATATSQPSYNPTGFNSTKPSVHFDASSSNYMTLASTLGHPANWTSFSIVSRPASADHMITLANATNGDRPYSIFLYASGSPTGPVYAGDGNSGAYYTDSATGPIVWSSQSNVANKSIWKNGTSQALTPFGGGYYADFNALGARPGNGEYSTGDMAEVVFYPTQLADIDRKKIECYEAQKWGLCSTLNGGNAATYCTGVGAKNDAGVLTAYCGATTP